MKTRFVAILLCLGAIFPAAGADTFDIDPVHSVAVFRIKHLGVSYTYGLFPNLTGSFTFDAEDPAACAIEVTASLSEMTTRNTDRDTHLRSEDFFDAAKHPAITFKSTEWKALEDGQYEVTGDLTLLGVTRSVTVPVEWVGRAVDPRGDDRCGFDANLAIKRSDFGMDGFLDMIGDEVRLHIGIEGIRQP
jgi:polyisoprenoid-binding protein YceI